MTLVVNGALKTSINNTTLEPGESTQLNFDLTQTRASVTVKVYIGSGYRRFREVVCQAAGLKLMTAGLGQRKLAPTTLYELVARNYNGQFTAWTSRGGNSLAGNLPVTKHVLFSLLGVTEIQNKIVAAAARIGFTCGFKPVISREAHCSRICPGRCEKIFILGQTD